MLFAMLKIDLSFLGFETFITISNWDQGLQAYTVHTDGYHQPVDGNVGFELDAIRESAGGEEWIRSIPVEYLNVAEPYGGKAIHMLMLAAQSSFCLELLEKRPNLLALICHHFPANSAAIKTIAKNGQRHSLKELNFIAAPSALRFLDKLSAENFDNSGISLIIGALQTGQYLKLSHYKQVSIYELRLNKLIPKLSQSSIGYWFHHQSNQAKIYTSFMSKFRLATKVGDETKPDLLQQALNFPSFDALKTYCKTIRKHAADAEAARLAELRLSKTDYSLKHPNHYPRSNIVGTENIIPIVNCEMLQAEHELLNNNVIIHHSNLCSYRFQAFQVLKPVRATAIIKAMMNSTTKQAKHIVLHLIGTDGVELSDELKEKVHSELGLKD